MQKADFLMTSHECHFLLVKMHNTVYLKMKFDDFDDYNIHADMVLRKSAVYNMQFISYHVLRSVDNDFLWCYHKFVKHIYC